MLCRARDLENPIQATAGSWPRFSASCGRITELSGPGALDVLCPILREAQQQAAQYVSANGSKRRADVPEASRVVWIMTHQALPFAPDLVANGVAVRDIAFVFTSAPVAAAQAAEQCLRSNGVDLVILDFANPAEDLCATHGYAAKERAGDEVGSEDRRGQAQLRHGEQRRRRKQLSERLRAIDNAVLGRLMRLCRRSHAAILAITEQPGDLAGSLVFTRFTAERGLISSADADGAGVGAGTDADGVTGSRFVTSLKIVKSKTGPPNAVYREVLRGPYGML